MLETRGQAPPARAISMRVISPFCGSIELALIHTDGTGKGLEVGPYHAITTGAQYGLSASHCLSGSALREGMLCTIRRIPFIVAA